MLVVHIHKIKFALWAGNKFVVPSAKNYYGTNNKAISEFSLIQNRMFLELQCNSNINVILGGKLKENEHGRTACSQGNEDPKLHEL